MFRAQGAVLGISGRVLVCGEVPLRGGDSPLPGFGSRMSGRWGWVVCRALASTIVNTIHRSGENGRFWGRAYLVPNPPERHGPFGSTGHLPGSAVAGVVESGGEFCYGFDAWVGVAGEGAGVLVSAFGL